MIVFKRSTPFGHKTTCGASESRHLDCSIHLGLVSFEALPVFSRSKTYFPFIKTKEDLCICT